MAVPSVTQQHPAFITSSLFSSSSIIIYKASDQFNVEPLYGT